MRWPQLKLIVRVVVLATAVLFAIGVFQADLSVILPCLSPFLGVCSAIAVRSVNWLFLFCVPVLILSLLRGRWFCFNICPTGLLAEYTGKLRPGAKSKFKTLPQLGPFLVLFAFGGALLGYPVFLWLDPLCIFNGFFSVWHMPVMLKSVLLGVGLVLILLLSVWRPNAWCYRFCPLGFSQELLGKLGRHVRQQHVGGNKGRRLFLAALIGGVVGAVARKVCGQQAFIRPPGAVEENKFTAICARCGNCIRACPEKIIRTDIGQSGVTGLLTPVIEIGPKYCSEWCSECNKVCPTNAIAHMSLEDKRTVSIGTAKVEKSLCLAWENRMNCMVCDEFCGYHAIRMIEKDGVNCPEVDPDICRGCGLCQTVCPADKTAIIVYGRPQKKLKPVEM